MVVMLEGVVVKKEPTKVWLKVCGVTYEINISVNCYNDIQTDNIEFLITQIIREDANLLFGFLNLSEQKMFEGLIKISGVGPKAAMAICSTFSPQLFASIISSSDVISLKKVVGIGPKTAARVLVELGGFSVEEGVVKDNTYTEAFMALESLGFKKEEITRAMQGISAQNSGVLVKEALKKLQRV